MDDRPVFFVGDIHGCAIELELLLERAGFRPATHRLLPVGDTINRGPDAPGVLDRLEQAAAEPILGNHERALIEIHYSGYVPPWAESPRSAYAQLTAAGRWEAEIRRIALWPYWREGAGREGADWIAVHAGHHPIRRPADTHPGFLTEVRFCDEVGGLPGHAPNGAIDSVPKGALDPPEGFRPWYDHYTGKKTVIFGHWARRGLVREEKSRGLDTGCVYGGRLTGLWWPEDKVVQVDALKNYRPVIEGEEEGVV